MERNFHLAVSFAVAMLVMLYGVAAAKPPVPDVKLSPIPITGKSGKFNVYAIQPADDLDALKYFAGNTVYKPNELESLLPIIDPKDQVANGFTCEYLCADKAGRIVGRVRVFNDIQVKK